MTIEGDATDTSRALSTFQTMGVMRRLCLGLITVGIAGTLAHQSAKAIDIVVKDSAPASGGPSNWRFVVQSPLTLYTDQCVFKALCSSADGWCGNPYTAMYQPARDVRDDQLWNPPVLAPEITSSQAVCSSKLRMDGYEYPLIQTADFYGSALVLRAPGTVTNCRRRNGSSPTGTGPIIVALNSSVLGAASFPFRFRPTAYGMRIDVTSVDRDIQCQGGTVAPPDEDDPIFANGFEVVGRIFANGFERQ